MVDKTLFSERLDAYKNSFHSHWPDEKYKWEAIKWFQDNWDVNSPDFAEMLNRALDRTFNLLASINNYPRRMIVSFAKAAPEEVRAMFIALFDENKDVFERIDAFKNQSAILLEKYGNGAIQHYQYENAISTYLWLRFPDKYYIYRFGEARTMASEIGSDYHFKKGAYAENIRCFLKLYDEVCVALKEDIELVTLLQSALTDSCYSDPELKTLTADFGFFISKYYLPNQGEGSATEDDDLEETDSSLYSEDWFPSTEEYTPGISKEQWLKLLNNKSIIGPVWGGVLAAFYDAGGAATCTQIAQKYNKTASGISGNCTQLAKRIYKETKCPLSIRENGKNRYWPILFQGKNAGADVPGGYIWKLRQELYDALKEFDILRFLWKEETSAHSDWWPADYQTGLTIEKWIAILQDQTIITPNNKKLLLRYKDYSEGATCKQMSLRYGETEGFYNMGGSTLAKRIGQRYKIEPAVDEKEGKSYWFPILFLGKVAEKGEPGGYKWKLRDEISLAIDHVDFSDVSLYEETKSKEENSAAVVSKLPGNYWWLTANPKIWSIANLAVGEEQDYTLYNENGNKRRVFQNFIDAKEGDMVIGYESNPVKQIVAIATISRGQDGERLFFRKVEGLTTPIDYSDLKACPELEKMEYFVNQQGSLFKLTKAEYECIMDMIREVNPREHDITNKKYTKEDFLNDVFMTENQYDTLDAILQKKKNIILQGAPGVGKTYAAMRLAYAVMGEKDETRTEFVQFHQNYSYEDFVMGYKPSGDSFELKYGVFYRFCQKASNQPNKKFFFIIDEINRGNMSKIFGELLMLIENDYRGKKATLAYNGMPFSVPENIYIIGMMNTADRSLAMIDYALRRRFSFFTMEPGFTTEGFLKIQHAKNSETLDALLEQVIALNTAIEKDKSLGKGFCIGHSYFCGLTDCSDLELQSIVNYDIIPMLSEYWFDEPTKLQEWTNRLLGVFQK